MLMLYRLVSMKKVIKEVNRVNEKKGFTLIEVMVATGIFVVVITIGIGALLNVTRAHRATAEIRQAVDTLYFVMEDISRNARLGTVFRFNPQSTGPQEFPINANGSSGQYTLAFTNYLAPRTDILYPNDPNYLYVYQLVPGNSGGYKLQKTTHEGTFDMTPPSISIDSYRSGFSVANASLYPLVTIRLYGTIKYQSTVIPFNIETSISPRTI